MKKDYETKNFGCRVGFYYKGKFMHDYGCEILDVIAWIILPRNDY